MPVVMASAAWRAAREAYQARVRPRVEDRLKRAGRREKHPVHDFLFEYYSHRPSHLMRWSPGWGVCLEGATRGDVEWPEFEPPGARASSPATGPELPVCVVVEEDAVPSESESSNSPELERARTPALPGLILHASSFPAQRVSYLEWAVRHLEATLTREPNFACFGLHEWAMVYRDPNVRHPYVPLRLPRDEIDSFVESQSLRCTHYDAFRFFSKDAAPRNRIELTRSVATEHEQPGCIHANMDLYRFAYKIAPFGPSELLADAFELAEAARAVDMRASPYDLSGYGYAAIPIETREGREEYVVEQRRIAERAAPIRERMFEVYDGLLGVIAQSPSTSAMV